MNSCLPLGYCNPSFFSPGNVVAQEAATAEIVVVAEKDRKELTATSGGATEETVEIEVGTEMRETEKGGEVEAGLVRIAGNLKGRPHSTPSDF